jgi:hypothetical protein
LDRLGGPLGADPSYFRRGLIRLALYHDAARDPQSSCSIDPRTIRAPAILASMHVGAFEASGALLRQLPGEVACLVAWPWSLEGSLRRLPIGGGEWERAWAVRQALDTLRQPGFLFVASDGAGDPRVSVPFAGARISLALGAFRLARLEAAPVLPVLSRWRGRRVHFSVGGPIDPAEPVQMAVEFAQALERLIGQSGDRALARTALRRVNPEPRAARAALRSAAFRSR